MSRLKTFLFRIGLLFSTHNRLPPAPLKYLMALHKEVYYYYYYYYYVKWLVSFSDTASLILLYYLLTSLCSFLFIFRRRQLYNSICLNGIRLLVSRSTAKRWVNNRVRFVKLSPSPNKSCNRATSGQGSQPSRTNLELCQVAGASESVGQRGM